MATEKDIQVPAFMSYVNYRNRLENERRRMEEAETRRIQMERRAEIRKRRRRRAIAKQVGETLLAGVIGCLLAVAIFYAIISQPAEDYSGYIEENHIGQTQIDGHWINSEDVDSYEEEKAAAEESEREEEAAFYEAVQKYGEEKKEEEAAEWTAYQEALHNGEISYGGNYGE